MATRTTTLALEVVTDLGDAAADLGRIETAADSAAGAIDKLQAATDGASTGIDKVSGAADGLDSTGGAAAGALGALSSGFELVGADKAAEGLQKAAMATDFLSGVGQAAALATKAQGAATVVLTGAQTALNTVMAANPIMLVVVAVGLLVAGLVLAYNKSETFRDIVNSAGELGKAAFAKVTDAIGFVVDKGQALIDKARDIPEGFRDAKDKVVGFMDSLMSPIQAVIDKVQALIGYIKGIDFPDIPDLNPFNGRGTGGGGGNVPVLVTSPLGRAADESQVVTLLTDILAALKSNPATVADPLGTAQTLRQLLLRADRISS